MKISNLLPILLLILCVQAKAQESTEPEDSTYYDLAEEEEDFTFESGYTLKSYFKNYDSSAFDLRSFDSARIESLKQDPELSYGYTKAALNLWETFWNWVGRLLRDMFQYRGTTVSWRIILFGLSVIAIVFVILRLLKINNLNMLYSGSKGKKVTYTVIEENIHEMDFEKLLRDAIRNDNFRLAIRLLFLYGLKILSDHHHIYWEPGKTNHDYVNELKAGDLKKDFQKLNYYFEYAWYGNFIITRDLFNTVNTLFSDWKNKT